LPSSPRWCPLRALTFGRTTEFSLPPPNGVLGSFPHRTCNSAYAPTFPSRPNPTDTREANRTRRGPRLRREEKIIHGQSFLNGCSKLTFWYVSDVADPSV